MRNHRNDLLDLHPAAVVGSLLGARPQQGVAAEDAEPEAYEPRQSALRRSLSSYRARRTAAAAGTESGRA
jgi:hypothetical protein